MRCRRDDRGSTLVEFALVMPVILWILLGILQYGYHYWALETAAATARDAARRYAVGAEQACTVAEAKLRADGPALGAVSVSGPPLSPAVGDVVTVTVSFQSLNMHLPVIGVPDGGVVTETADARIESVPSTPLTCS